MFYSGAVSDQEQLWAETLADDPATEDVQRGGLTPTNIDPRLYHDIQVQLNRLIGKAEKLIGNVTTYLAESISEPSLTGEVINIAKLRKLYFDTILPQLACPRFRYGGIREP